jgi:polar amino acid transport system substrate-binding protein
MKARIVLALVVVALATAGCGSPSTSPPPVAVAPVDAKPSGAREITTMPVPGNAKCVDPEASLRPDPLPAPGAMPPGSTMATIHERGQLIVGVDQDSFPFGFRDSTTGQLEGFDIDLAREIARAIFGPGKAANGAVDPDHIELKVINPTQRESVLQSGEVDLVVRTYSINCEREDKVAFSATYFYANQKILVMKGSGIDSAAALSGKRVCSAFGTTSLSRLFALDPRPTLFGAATWTDCLVMLQQGQVDAISTDDAVLAGLRKQDQENLEIVGDSMGLEPYGVGVNKQSDDLVRFVNGVLARMRADGTWERLYDHWLTDLGPSPGPPAPRYKDGP